LSRTCHSFFYSVLGELGTSGTLAPNFGPYNDFEFFGIEVIVRFCQLAFMVVWFVIMATRPVVPQSNTQSYPQSPTSQKPSPEDEPRLKIEKEMAKKANQARQVNLKRDTEQLLKLATELKEYVDKTNENTLSLDVLKKAEEIEKLARSVKDKMKGSY
jgi:methionyl-tRNA synthetase